MAVEFPAVDGHPNRVAFEGVLTLVDRPSDKAPSGARGHRVVLTRAAAEAALPSLLGMAVDFKAGWDGHDAKQKCGILTSAEIEGDALRVRGYLFARDFTEMMAEMQAHGDEALGMSYELADAHVEDMRASVWRLTRATFTGAAILLRTKAAYRATSFRLAASAAAGQRAATAACGRAGVRRRDLLRDVRLRRNPCRRRVLRLIDRRGGEMDEQEIVGAIVADADVEAGAIAELERRICELEAAMGDLRAVKASAAGRKTQVSVMAKAEGAASGAVDEALRSLSVEQRIAVKSGLVRAGLMV